MYILTFKKNKSKNFPTVLKIAEDLGATWDGEICTLEIGAVDLLRAYEDLLDLFKYIHNWSGIRATFRGKPVHPYRFIFKIYSSVSRCSRKKFSSVDPRHCWIDRDTRGWGCKLLTGLLRYTLGSGNYKISNRYWYNFGEYIDRETWKIDKVLILERIRREIEEKALFLCPYFNIQEIDIAIRSLPDFIKVDNTLFTYHYAQEYVDGKKINVPVNIRHIPPKKEIASFEEIISQDPGRFQWN